MSACPVLWEREVDAKVLKASLWNNVASRGFDSPDKFAAYLNAIRWNLVTSTNPKLFQAPHRAGIQVMTYQLEPLRKALHLPRVNLFIADDVGLGKTIEAGLILREMIMRQKVKRIVIACPASVITQWQTEMEVRFGLTFVILDREYVIRCRRERGYGINPWKTHSRFIVSHALLRDEQYGEPLRDWLQEYKAGSMLVLDEAHHAAPATSSRYAVDSQFTRAMRELTGLFEHRLFLSATPHNGHSNSFSALLEMLDPQRFFRGEKVTNPKLLDEVMVRRLKDELRELVPNLGLPKRIVKQHDISGLPEDAPELKLMRLLNEYRELRENRMIKATRGQQAAASLVICTLQKRLLSSVEAFASTLRVHRKGLNDQTPEHFDEQTQLDLDAPGADDERSDLPEEQVSEELEAAVARASKRSRGTEPPTPREIAVLDEMASIADRGRGVADARVKELADWIRTNLLDGSGRWNHRRVLIFTEYTETKRYLEQQLQSEFARTDRMAERIATFHGGMGRQRLDAIKLAFNTAPEKHPLRILIATDAAREGVNFQNHCADLFHFDVPWNPSRMEQRNGRIDRKLQREKEVRCHYFVYTQRPEDDVIRTLVRKTETIQKELGSLSPVLEKRIEDLLSGGLRAGLAEQIAKLAADSEERKRVEEEQESVRKRGKALSDELENLSDLLEDSKRFVGLNVTHFRNALSLSLELNHAPALEPIHDHGPSDKKHGPARFAFPEMDSSTWAHTLDSLRSPRKKDQKIWEWREENPILPVVFESPEHIDDTCVHLHLEHRVVQRLLGRFRAQGFVFDDLARACVGQTDDAIRRIILIGRLSLYGPGASRLHDELVMVTSRWVDPVSRKEPLKPYADDSEKYTIQMLEKSFEQARDRNVRSEVEDKLKSHAPQDVAELLPHLQKRADAAAVKAKELLGRRGEKESKELRAIIENQEKRILKLQGEDSAQMTLGFDERELRQRDAERKSWNKRLSDIAKERDEEPAQIVRNYEVQTARVEPIGVVYLWPISG